jgi:predicted Zn-dependent protease
MKRSVPLVALALACVTACGASRPLGASNAADSNGAIPRGPKHLDLTRSSVKSSDRSWPTLRLLASEVRHEMLELRTKARTPPYYLAYDVIDSTSVEIVAAEGAVVSSAERSSRTGTAEIRVGSPALDNTRLPRGSDDYSHYLATSMPLPLGDDGAALRSRLWLTTHRDFERALADLVHAKADAQIKVAQEDASHDFSLEDPVRFLQDPAGFVVDRGAWETRLARHSAAFHAYAGIQSSEVRLSTLATTRYFANSEASTVQLPATEAHVMVSADTTAADGMSLSRQEILDARKPDGLPGDDVIDAAVKKVATDLEALAKAPLVEPYTGPAILDGRAAAVFFHEIFGHRIEGHRQKNEDEGQTFTRKVGQPIMPAFLDVYDDPLVDKLGTLPLNGHYLIDDEGVPAQKAVLVKGGILRGFLMSRSPIRGFDHSNGHGRRSPGYRPVARQGNLIVDPAETTTPEGLKQLLLREVKRQGRPFGLRFTEITGGYTNTSRGEAQAFKVLPVMVYRVFPDGREELVRGADLEGTPLTVLSRIMAAANDFQVFNGSCGAESGWVPVSAVSPSLLVSQIEVARRAKEQDRPPLLPAPSESAPRAAKGRP